jgi:hypothetical protein
MSMYKILSVTVLLLATFASTSGSKQADASPTTSSSPTLVARVSLTGQTSDIATATLFTPKVSGLYRVNTYMVQTTPLNSSYAWYLTIGWTDDAGVETCTGILYMNFGQAPPEAWATATSTPGNVSIIEAIAGQPVTYGVSDYGQPAGGTYSVYITAEKL